MAKVMQPAKEQCMFRHTPTTTRPWTSCMELSTGQRPHMARGCVYCSLIVARDFNSANLRKVLPRYHQHISCPTRGQKLKRDGPVTRTIQQWSEQSDFGSARLLQHDGVVCV
ncbi:hypothetical protein L3Q82_007589 [Scortum barcoo]|uniref:Uncharacterized protein n=1 Tax=Scortum barcoo TaxID=214431 RepID=A0ACB8WPZ6_9TELE|nr:hypothetical protein L3Q82_007589 [Scortum barcoo]